MKMTTKIIMAVSPSLLEKAIQDYLMDKKK